jgi:transposase
MNARELAEELWPVIQPLLPPEPPKPKGGRPRIPDRNVLTGIVFMLLSSCSWANLPAKPLGCGSPATCWRRVRDWQQAGVWDQLHQVLLAELRRAGQLDFSRSSLDSVSVRAKRAGELTGANPVDRGKRGSKYHLLVERGGVPLAAAVSAANTPDAQLLECVVDAVPAVKGRRGRPRRRPAKLHTDKAYDSTACRWALRRRGITPRISRRGIESSERLGRWRWVVERSLAWLLGCRRLQVRYERRSDILHPWLTLACAVICLEFLQRTPQL